MNTISVIISRDPHTGLLRVDHKATTRRVSLATQYGKPVAKKPAKKASAAKVVARNPAGVKAAVGKKPASPKKMGARKATAAKKVAARKPAAKKA